MIQRGKIKKNRRTVGRLLMALLLLCTGCGNSGQMTESEKVGVQREGEVSLKFSIWSDEESYVRDVTEAYNALKGYEAISLEVIPNSQHEDWVNHYNDAYATDIIGIRGNGQLLQFQKQKKLLGLSRFIKESNLDIRNYGTMINEIICSGEYYALPTRSTCWALYYNRKLFQERGVPEPEQMTWEEYMELAERMTEKRTEIWGGYYPPWIYNIPAIQQGYYLLDDELEPTRESLELMQKIYASGSHFPYDRVKDRGDFCSEDFEKGNIAMLVCGEWLANMFLEDQAEGIEVPEWGIAPLPVPAGVEAGTSIGMYQFAGLTSVCRDPEAAFEFLQFLCGPQGAQIYARNGIIPGYSNEEIQEIYLDAVGTEDARIFFDAKRIQEQPVWEGYDQLTELFKEDACELLEGNCELDEIMERFQEQREEVFGKINNE